MKSDGGDNTLNLVQINTKNTQAKQGGSIINQYRKTTMESNTEDQQGSILTAVCFTDTG